MTSALPQVSVQSLRRLPIFPLPNTVLFPGSLLPLHVFEARYRQLTAAILEGDKLLAVPLLKPGYESEYHESPEIYRTAGVGKVLASDKLEDGRYNLLVRGLARVTICSEHPHLKSYREVEARLLRDVEAESSEELASLRSQAVALCDRIAGNLPKGGDALRDLVHQTTAPGRMADILAAQVVKDPREKQRLIELLDPAARLERVLEPLARLAAELSTGQSN